MPTHNALQQLITTHMELTGESMADIAARGGFPRQTLSALMHREGPKSIPRKETLARLAIGLRIDLDIVERAAGSAAGSGVASEDIRLQQLIAYARKLDDDHLKVLTTTAKALGRVG